MNRRLEAFARHNRGLIRAMRKLDDRLQAKGLSFQEGFFEMEDIKKRGGNGEQYFRDYVNGQAGPIGGYL